MTKPAKTGDRFAALASCLLGATSGVHLSVLASYYGANQVYLACHGIPKVYAMSGVIAHICAVRLAPPLPVLVVAMCRNLVHGSSVGRRLKEASAPGSTANPMLLIELVPTYKAAVAK